MGVLGGAEDGEKKAEAVFGREIEGFGVLGYPGTVDVLHDEVGDVFGGGAAVEEAGDVGMFKAGENLAFATEAFEDELGIETGFDKLDGDLGFVLFVGAGGEVDGTHAAAAEFADEGIGADAATFDGRVLIGAEPDDGVLDLGDDELGGVFAIAIEKRFDFVEQIEIVAAGAPEPGFTLGGGEFEGFVEEGFDFLPALGIHCG